MKVTVLDRVIEVVDAMAATIVPAGTEPVTVPVGMNTLPMSAAVKLVDVPVTVDVAEAEHATSLRVISDVAETDSVLNVPE